MTRLALIRHARTDWNEQGLIQGHTDRPLSADGCIQAGGWRVPEELAGFAWVAGPLTRTRETARILLGHDVPAEPALVEAGWGEWEGRSLAELDALLGDAFAENEARGLDFQPPGGESPRQVQARLRPWLARVARAGRPTAAVTHKGVIRAALGLATGWDFLGKPPARLDWACAHLFALEVDGQPRVERLNIPLVPSGRVP
jgi:broad specificity phosphatase PhoE